MPECQTAIEGGITDLSPTLSLILVQGIGGGSNVLAAVVLALRRRMRFGARAGVAWALF